MQPRPLEVDPQALGRADAVVAVVHGLLDVEDHARRALAAPEAQVEDLGQAARGGAGQGGVLRPRSLPHRRLDLGRARRLGEGGQVLAPGARDLLAVGARARDLAEAAAQVLRDQAPIGLDGVARVAPLEAPGHLAVEVADREQRVVAVAALRVARDQAPEAHHDLLPLRLLAHAGRGTLEGGERLLRVLVEAGVRTRVGRARRPRPLPRRVGGQGRRTGGGAHHEGQGGHDRAPPGRSSGHFCQLSTVS